MLMKFLSNRQQNEFYSEGLHPLLRMLVPFVDWKEKQRGGEDFWVTCVCRSKEEHFRLYTDVLGKKVSEIPKSAHCKKPSHAIDLTPVTDRRTAEFFYWRNVFPWLKIVVHTGKDGFSTGVCYHLEIIEKEDPTKINY